jgi:hypothetical protein
MIEQSTLDPEKILAGFRERHEEMFAAGRKTWLETAEAMEQAVSAYTDAQAELADATDVEWLSKLLRAQATFTRDLVGASSRFARELFST